MKLPLIIEMFIRQAVQSGHFALPFHYPEAGVIESLQWFSNLEGSEDGRWQPGWYVIALNGRDDPFFVDLAQAALEYPVYYCSHDAGKWEAIQIAESIPHLIRILVDLSAIQNDDEATLRYLETTVVLENELWEEVYKNIKYSAQFKEPAVIDPSLLINGIVAITDFGHNKLKVVHWLKDYLGLRPQEALSLSKQQTVQVQEGLLLHMQIIIDQLNHLGATAMFIPSNEDETGGGM